MIVVMIVVHLQDVDRLHQDVDRLHQDVDPLHLDVDHLLLDVDPHHLNAMIVEIVDVMIVEDLLNVMIDVMLLLNEMINVTIVDTQEVNHLLVIVEEIDHAHHQDVLHHLSAMIEETLVPLIEEIPILIAKMTVEIIIEEMIVVITEETLDVIVYNFY